MAGALPVNLTLNVRDHSGLRTGMIFTMLSGVSAVSKKEERKKEDKTLLFFQFFRSFRSFQIFFVAKFFP